MPIKLKKVVFLTYAGYKLALTSTMSDVRFGENNEINSIYNVSATEVKFTGMSDQEKQLYRLVRWNRLWLVLLILLVLGFTGLFCVKKVLKNVYSLHVAWHGDALHVYSGKDGPFVITHLVKLGNSEYAAAQLPHPVTIIDSRGHYFSKVDIESLEWIGTSGKQQSPPAVGTDVKAFYFIPLETEPTSRKKY